MQYYYVRTRFIFIGFLLLSIYFTMKITTATYDEKGVSWAGFLDIKRRVLHPPPLAETNASIRMKLNDTMKTLLDVNVNCSSEHFYDVPEWTLQIFKEDEAEKSVPFEDATDDLVGRCRHKRDVLFEREMVKTLIRGKGYENYGCRNDTPQCSHQAHYDKLHKVRVNTPPCCRAKIIEIFARTTTKLAAMNITHFIQFGGLIGFHRNKKMIPYDVDIDLYVDHEAWKKLPMNKLIKEFDQKYGFGFQYHDRGDKLKIFYSKMNNNSIDVWPFKIITDHSQRAFVRIPHWSAVDQPMKNMFPLRRVQFENTWTFVPRNPVDVLNLQYGAGTWETEVTCRTKDSNGNCSPEPKEQTNYATDDMNDHTIKYLLCFLFSFFVIMVSLFFLVVKCVSAPNYRETRHGTC